jgi:selenocysteine lyase/cysteine desulfurase
MKGSRGLILNLLVVAAGPLASTRCCGAADNVCGPAPLDGRRHVKNEIRTAMLNRQIHAVENTLGCQRLRFDIPGNITWLDAAYMSPLSQSTAAAGARGVAHRATPWDLPSSAFFQEVEAARREFATLIHATSDDVAIVPAVSYGIEVAVRNLPVHGNDRIVVLADQFPSNFYAWQELCNQTGANLVRVPWPADCDWTTNVLAAIDERTQIVALPNCHWTDGTMVDLRQVATRCREVKSALVLDVTQSLGAHPLDVNELKPDFLVCASYKWLLGPYSLSYLYAAPHRQAGRPIENTPWARESSDAMLDWRTGPIPYAQSLMCTARRYDMGERANFTLMPMSIAALSEINAWQPARISTYLELLVERAAMRAQALGLGVPPHAARAPHMIGVVMPERLNAVELTARLRVQGIYVSMRGGKLRIAPHVYNALSDIDRLFDVLQELL